MRKVLVLFSGGLDSTVCLYLAIQDHGKENVHALIFDYGQVHSSEISCAIKICEKLNISFDLLPIGGILKSSSPLLANASKQYNSDGVEKTFVPMRNMLFLTIAINRALTKGAANVVIGVNDSDNNYPDCSYDFILSLQTCANRSIIPKDARLSRNPVTIMTPLLYNNKRDTILLSRTLPGCYEMLAYTHTGYDGKYPPVSTDLGNTIRAKGFEEAGFPDPLIVRAWREKLMPLPRTNNYKNIDLLGV